LPFRPPEPLTCECVGRMVESDFSERRDLAESLLAEECPDTLAAVSRRRKSDVLPSYASSLEI